MTNAASEFNTIFQRLLERQALSDREISRILDGERLLHDIGLNTETIGDIIEDFCIEFEIDSSGFDYKKYYFQFGGIDDYAVCFRKLPFFKKYLELKYSPIDLLLFRKSANEKMFPPGASAR